MCSALFRTLCFSRICRRLSASLLFNRFKGPPYRLLILRSIDPCTRIFTQALINSIAYSTVNQHWLSLHFQARFSSETTLQSEIIAIYIRPRVAARLIRPACICFSIFCPSYSITGVAGRWANRSNAHTNTHVDIALYSIFHLLAVVTVPTITFARSESVARSCMLIPLTLILCQLQNAIFFGSLYNDPTLIF